MVRIAGGGISLIKPVNNLDSIQSVNNLYINGTIAATGAGISNSIVANNINISSNLNVVGNICATGSVGIGTANPNYKLDVNGSIATNNLLIRTVDYTRTLANIQYNANTWYEAIPPGALVGGIYIVTLQFNTTAPSTPWNLYGSFLHFAGITNYNQANYLSGAAIPTSMHTNTGTTANYQISVRGNYGSDLYAGIDLLIAGAPIGTGTWLVNAYRII